MSWAIPCPPEPSPTTYHTMYCSKKLDFYIWSGWAGSLCLLTPQPHSLQAFPSCLCFPGSEASCTPRSLHSSFTLMRLPRSEPSTSELLVPKSVWPGGIQYPQASVLQLRTERRVPGCPTPGGSHRWQPGRKAPTRPQALEMKRCHPVRGWQVGCWAPVSALNIAMENHFNFITHNLCRRLLCNVSGRVITLREPTLQHSVICKWMQSLVHNPLPS